MSEWKWKGACQKGKWDELYKGEMGQVMSKMKMARVIQRGNRTGHVKRENGTDHIKGEMERVMPKGEMGWIIQQMDRMGWNMDRVVHQVGIGTKDGSNRKWTKWYWTGTEMVGVDTRKWIRVFAKSSTSVTALSHTYSIHTACSKIPENKNLNIYVQNLISLVLHACHHPACGSHTNSCVTPLQAFDRQYNGREVTLLGSLKDKAINRFHRHAPCKITPAYGLHKAIGFIKHV